MKENLLYLAIFAIGLVLGVTDLLPFSIEESKLSLYLLYALMFVLGLTIGHDEKTLKGFRTLPRHLILLPFLTILGTTLGAAVAAFFLQKPLFPILAISAGQGYYSLTSVILNEELGAVVGAVALLANILRELGTILLTPLLVRVFGAYAPISSGGATSTAASLPFILKSTGQEYVIPAIYHGILLNISVPILVTLFAMLS